MLGEQERADQLMLVELSKQLCLVHPSLRGMWDTCKQARQSFLLALFIDHARLSVHSVAANVCYVLEQPSKLIEWLSAVSLHEQKLQTFIDQLCKGSLHVQFTFATG